MAELKTKLNDGSVSEFLNSIGDDKKRVDAHAIVKLMEDLSGEEPKMWGKSIIGFGSYHYKSSSGREGDWMLIGFSPRKQNQTLYIMPGFKAYEDLLAKLGKFKTGKSCLYIKKLEDIDEEVLSELIVKSVEFMRRKP